MKCILNFILLGLVSATFMACSHGKATGIPDLEKDRQGKLQDLDGSLPGVYEDVDDPGSIIVIGSNFKGYFCNPSEKDSTYLLIKSENERVYGRFGHSDWFHLTSMENGKLAVIAADSDRYFKDIFESLPLIPDWCLERISNYERDSGETIEGI